MSDAPIRFGDVTIDVGSRLVARDGASVHLSRRAFDALAVLVARRPAAVTKAELHARLWPDTFVVDANLSVVVAEVRRALGDDPQAPRFIRTVHRVGYAFCATPDERSSGREASPQCWLVCDTRVMPMGEGDHVIGRDPGCGVRIDAAGVSRRHARLRVSAGSTTIEDLGSKNGTFVGQLRIDGVHALADGDLVRLGPIAVEFRSGGGNRPTETVRIRRAEPAS